MDEFAALRKELELWECTGVGCQLWWRDDDLTTVTPQLLRMQEVSERNNVPALLAVIPGQATSTLGNDTAHMGSFDFAQHGWLHQNHEANSRAKSEFGIGRSIDASVEDMRRGSRQMVELFGKRYINVFVPPWNHLSTELPPYMETLDYLGLSRHVDQEKILMPPSIVDVNTHIDILQWATRPSLQKPDVIIAQLAQLLCQQREGRAVESPIGILSHHRVMADDSWQFLDELFSFTGRYHCVNWIRPSELFRPTFVT